MKKPNRKEREAWDFAFRCELAPGIAYDGLQGLRRDVVQYLNWVTRDLVQTEPEKALLEIQRAADRLTRLTVLIADAWKARRQGQEQDLAALRERNR
jgi:hypothetical protein